MLIAAQYCSRFTTKMNPLLNKFDLNVVKSGRKEHENYFERVISLQNIEFKAMVGVVDSNQRSRDQNPLPCRLATPQ